MAGFGGAGTRTSMMWAFLCRKTCPSIISADNFLRRLSTICPAKENTRSDATEVAGMHKYFRASGARRGNRAAFVLHHNRGSTERLNGFFSQISCYLCFDGSLAILILTVVAKQLIQEAAAFCWWLGARA